MGDNNTSDLGLDFSDILDVPEAAALLRLHKNTVLKLSNAGKIPCMKIASRYRYSRKALLEFVSKGCMTNIDSK